jgi:hypothetical protein
LTIAASASSFDAAETKSISSLKSDITTTTTSSNLLEKISNQNVPEQLNTLQIRHDSIEKILSYTRETFQRLEEDLLLLKANYNPILLDCLFFVWQAEIFKFCEYLLGNTEESGATSNRKIIENEAASTHINFLLHKKCEAVSEEGLKML